jgi:hypothetical protein
MSTVQDFDASVNLLAAILWQYEESERLKALAVAKQAWTVENQTNFWLGWYRDVFNIDTANAFGLSIWGRILNVRLGVDVAPQNKVAFGFGSVHKNFNAPSNFGVDADRTQTLTVEQQRLVIKLRYFQLTSRGTIPEINRFLAIMFGAEGGAFVIDGHDMTMIYQFNFTPNSQLAFILDEYDLLPRPATVGVSWQSQTSPVFGFGPHNLNFNNGNFGE